MDRTTLTAALKPLVTRGLAAAAIDANDRRSRRLALTPAGHALLVAAIPIWERTHAQVEERVTHVSPSGMRSALRGLA